MFQMAAAIITYELVLIQLDGSNGADSKGTLNVTSTWMHLFGFMLSINQSTDITIVTMSQNLLQSLYLIYH